MNMLIEPYAVGRFNAHYEGEYDAGAIMRRRVAAKDKVANLKALLGARKVSSVLEIGCGTGAVLAEIKRSGIGTDHVGIDVTDAAEHLDEGARDLNLSTYDGVTIPYPDQSFDLVVASHVVEHVDHPRGFLREAARVAKGFIYVEVPCEARGRMPRAIVQESINTGHINIYSPESFMVLLQTAGLNIVDFKLFDHSMELLSLGRSPLMARAQKIVRNSALAIAPITASRFFCYHCGALVAVAR